MDGTYQPDSAEDAARVGTLRIWPQLPQDVASQIIKHLTGNDIACSLRLANRAAAELLHSPQHTTVRLSELVPHQAFARHWGNKDKVQALTLKQRRKLLRLTAASGSIANLQLAIESTGCQPDDQVIHAAARANQRNVCQWLLDRGCPHGFALNAAAGAGHRGLCEWLLTRGCAVCPMAVCNAAAGGHTDLMQWLLLRLSLHQTRLWHLGPAVAQGCDLATLQSLPGLLQRLLPPDLFDRADFGVDLFREAARERLLASAAGSPTPDWRAKVEWLEAHCGCEPSASALEVAARRPDALERLDWLRRRGYSLASAFASASEALCCEAARGGRLDVLTLLLAEGAPLPAAAVAAAVEEGHLHVLRELRSRDFCGLPAREVVTCLAAELPRACRLGLPAVSWLHEQGLLPRGNWLLGKAARLGDVELMAWAREALGCGWGGAGGVGGDVDSDSDRDSDEDGDAFLGAVESGNVAAVEWLVEHGCPVPEGSGAYGIAAKAGDTAMLRALQRLGCPWGEPGEIFQGALMGGHGLAPLRLLLGAGCPVDWGVVWGMMPWAQVWWKGDVAELRAFLAEHSPPRRQREREMQGQQGGGGARGGRRRGRAGRGGRGL